MSPRISGVRRPRHRPYLARPWQRVTCVFLLLLSCCTPLASNAYELVCQPEAVVTTCAGGGVPGFREGVQERSHFRSPSGVVVSAHDGHVYVSDAGNNRVRKIEVDTNRVTTAVGSGQNGFQDGHTSRAQLSNPQGLAFSPDGLLFIADRGNNRIRVVDLVVQGVATFAGSGGSGYQDHPDPVRAQINSPLGLAYHRQTRVLYVTDGDSRVRGIRAHGDPNGAGVFTVLNGQGQAGYSDNRIGLHAVFNGPSFMAWDLDETVLFIADRYNHAIRGVDVATTAVSTVAGTGNVPDRNTSLGSDGVGVIGIAFDEPVGVAFYIEPKGVGDTSDNSDNSDDNSDTSTAGRPVLLVTELGANRVRRLVLNGNVSGSSDIDQVASFAYAGSYVASSGHDDALGPAALFSGPTGVAVVPGSNGSIAFVCDSNNHAARKLERKVSTRVRVSVEAIDIPAENYNALLYPTDNKADTILDEYGYYTINGPPNNETTHVSEQLTYPGEQHDFTMCAYPGQEYFMAFFGKLKVIVADDALFEQTNLTKLNTYISWTGSTTDSSRSENFKLKGSGCTDPGAPNYDAWAVVDDDSCLLGTKLLFTIESLGTFGVYQIEGPGVYYEGDLSLSDPDDNDETLYPYSNDTDTHTISFAAYKQAPYTIQMHGALSLVITDESGQTTNFTYLNHTSRNIDSHRIEMIKPAGPGCTQSQFINYSPFAVVDDGSCVEGSFLRIDSTSANSYELQDWFEFGLVSALQPLLLGGHAVLTPVLFTQQNTTAAQTVYVAPGRYPIDVFGQANVTVTKVSDDGEEVLLFVDGGDAGLKKDYFGFASTLGNSKAYLYVLGKDDESELSSADSDSVILGTGDDATVSGIQVANLTYQAKRNTLNDVTSGKLTQGSWDFVSQIFQLNPLRLKLDFLVGVTFPYDVEKLPTVKGNYNVQVVRASDETASDWRVVRNAVFDEPAQKVTLRTDTFSLFAVAAMAEVVQIEPQRVRPSGALITLDGIDFKVPPIGNLSGLFFCKFGDLLTKAEFVTSKELRGFGDAVRCPTPPIKKATFVAVEFYDASSLQNSQSDLRVLLTAPPDVSSVQPKTGPNTGNGIVFISGSSLQTANNDDPSIDCFFGDFGSFGSTAPGIAVSSALAICETPGFDGTRDNEVRVGVTSDGVHDAHNAMYKYRTALAEFFAEDDSEVKHLKGSDAGGGIVNIGVPFDGISSTVTNDLSCAFGSVLVSARQGSESNGGWHCVVPSKAAGKTSVYLRASLGERDMKISDFTFDSQSDQTKQSLLPLYAEFLESHGGFGVTMSVMSSLSNGKSTSKESPYTCAFAGVPVTTVLKNSRWISCAPSSQTSHGFVAVSILRNSADAPAATDITPIGQILLPSKQDIPTVLSAVNGPNLLTPVGTVNFINGKNLLPFGSGGSFDGVSGFGVGNGGDLVCAFGITTKHKGRVTAHFVSSAIVQCETPNAFDTYNDESQLIEAKLVIASLETSATSSLNSTRAVSVRILSSLTVTSVEGVQDGLPESGGAEISVTWQGTGGGSDVGSNANQFACAFGTVLPVAMRFDASSTNAGCCTSPALKTRMDKQSGDVSNSGDYSSSWFSLAFPNGARAESIYAKSSSPVSVVATRSEQFWMPVPSAVSVSGGGEILIEGWVPTNVGGCLFGGDSSGGGSNVAMLTNKPVCTTPALRGGFITLGLSGYGKGNSPGHVVETFSVPVATLTAPSFVNANGGIVFIFGMDFSSALESNAQTHCVLDDTVNVPALHVSSVVTRCEVPAYGAFASNKNFDENIKRAFGVSVKRGVDVPDFSGLAVGVYDTPVIATTIPTAVSADDGGVVITVKGIQFSNDNNRNARCAFGSVRVTANVASGFEAECVSPTHFGGVVPFAVQYEGDTVFTKGSTFVFEQ